MKSKREIVRRLVKEGRIDVSILRRGTFTCAGVMLDGRVCYGFSKCALSFDPFSAELGAKIAVNRALNELAQAILDKEHVLGFAPWVGETDYGVVVPVSLLEAD